MDKMTRSVQSAAMRKGTMLMEFVLTMPILFMLIMLVIQFAQVMLARQMVAYAAFCSTRSMLCSKPSEWQGSGKSSCAHQAARRALAWVNIYGTPKSTANGVLVPGWGHVPESDSVDKRLDVTTSISQAKYVKSTVAYKFPLLVPVAGQMVGFLSKDRAENSLYVSSKTMMAGWTGETGDLVDEIPYILLTETCVLPLPYSTVNMPKGAFDNSYD